MMNNMTIRYNPSISEEPRYQVAQPIVRAETQESILDWLDRIGRLLPRVDDSQTVAISRNDEGK